jgi:tetratricopeptide (TPR) repeat protein
MRAIPRLSSKLKDAAPLLLAALLLAVIGAFGSPAAAFDAGDNPPGDIENPADVAPDDSEMRLEDELIEPDDLDLENLMRSDTKAGRGDAPPPQSTEESKQDKLAPPADDLPLPTPPDKPKMLAELYEQLHKAPDEEAALPIMEAIQNLWKVSGSPTIDLLMQRADRFAREEDLELALKIIDAAVDMAPEEAEAWYLKARVSYLKKDYGQAIADLRRALDRDPKHYEAMNDLGMALEATGAKQEALEAYRKTLALNPFHRHAMRAEEELRRELEGRGI